MNDYDEEGVEIRSYISSEQPHSASQYNALKRTPTYPADERSGNWAITIWSLAGLLCLPAYFIVLGANKSPGMNPSLMILIAGGIISLITMSKHQRAIKPNLVQAVGTLNMVLVIVILAFAFLDTYILSAFD